MSLKSLIENQVIIIDDHKRGTGEIKKWDSNDDVHIDKKTQYKIEGKLQEVRIRVPINSDRKISIETKSNKMDSIPRKLKKEITGAFENKKQRERFIKDLIEVIKNFESFTNSIDQTIDAMNKISKHFELEWSQEKIQYYVKDSLKSTMKIYKDISENKYYILLNNKKLEIGQINNLDFKNVGK